MVLENNIFLFARRKLQSIIGLCSLLLLSQNVLAVDPALDWKTIESEHLYVHFAASNKQLAEKAVAIAEIAHKRLSKELDWQPKQKTHIVISDETDQPNGFATPIFFNRSVLFIASPSSINTLEDFDDWFATLIIHEYTHIIHLDKSSGSPEFLRKIFGRLPFLFANAFQPAWVTEGLATYKESSDERGIGRGQSATFASMMRAEVANGLQPIDYVNLPVSSWPAGTTRYLYGVYFMKFLVEKYGEDGLQQWINEYSDNLLPFFINTNAKQTLGENLTPLWQQYQVWLQQRFQPQIDAITAQGLTTSKKISKTAYRTDSVRVMQGNKGDEIYYVRNSGYQRAALMHINAAGKAEQLFYLNSSANIDLHENAGVLITQSESCNNYTVYEDIYHYHPATKKLKRLTECGRYLFASWLPSGEQMIAVHHDAGKFELQLLDNQANQKQTLWRATEGEIIAQIDISADGKQLVAAMWRKTGGWNLELFDIQNRRWKKISTGTNIKAYPQFTEQGNIIFSMEEDHVYNLYRYHLESKKIEKLSNLIGGAFQSTQARENGAIYYTGYSAQGYAIYKLAANNIDGTVNEQQSISQTDILKPLQYSLIEHTQQDYSAWSNMYPRWWFPSFGFTDQRSELGLTSSGSDALGIHQYSISASYDTKLKRAAGSLSYGYADRLFLSGQRINEIFLDSKGNVARIFKRSVASAVIAFPKNFLQRQYNVLLAVIYDNTTDDEAVIGTPALNDFEDHLLGVAALYNSSDFNPLSISANDGMNLRLVAEDSDTLNSDFSGQVYTLDWRQFIRTGRESVLALRFVQGWGSDNPRRFKLGGEGFSDNAVGIIFGSSQQPVFDVRSYALRGYREGEAELRGRRMQLISGEWRFPLQRVERGLMAPPVGIMQWFGNVFVELGSAYQDSPERYYSSAGFEVSVDFSVFYLLTLRTRLGYAHGFDSQLGDDRVYLKIGSSF